MKCVTAIAHFLFSFAAAAQDKHPSRPIQLPIPLAAGTSADFTFRPIADLPYNTLRDFAGVAMVVESPTIVVYPKLGVRSVKELIALAKSQPGKINYGTSGVGTTTHLAN